MESRSTQDARRDFAALIEDVLRGEHVELTRYGRPVAAIVPMEWYEAVAALLAELEALEEYRNRSAALRAGRRSAGLHPQDRRVVHHIDGDPYNNDPANLEIRERDENSKEQEQ